MNQVSYIIPKTYSKRDVKKAKKRWGDPIDMYVLISWTSNKGKSQSQHIPEGAMRIEKPRFSKDNYNITFPEKLDPISQRLRLQYLKELKNWKRLNCVVLYCMVFIQCFFFFSTIPTRGLPCLSLEDFSISFPSLPWLRLTSHIVKFLSCIRFTIIIITFLILTKFRRLQIFVSNQITTNSWLIELSIDWLFMNKMFVLTVIIELLLIHHHYLLLLFHCVMYA